MLAGFIIATHDADDRPATLTATLPFGGVTLIEYQARMLVAAGASQLVILVARLTPELLGAINRIGRRGVAVDTVRTAAEAVEKLHPLARILMLADGLTTTEATVRAMGREGGDALLVLSEEDAIAPYERVGGGMVWAGIARLEAARLIELASLPRDYDVQSTLVRLAAQAQAVHLLLPEAAIRGGHGIGHSAAALETRGRTVLAAMVSTRNGWFDRFVVAPLARTTTPVMVAKTVPVAAVAGGAAVLGIIALLLMWLSHPGLGLLLAAAGSVGLSIAATLAGIRDEDAAGRACRIAAATLPALAVLLYGREETVLAVEGTPLTLAIGVVALAALGERAIGGMRRRSWWGSAAAYLLPVWCGAVVEAPVIGLSLAAIYAGATLTAAIERLRALVSH